MKEAQMLLKDTASPEANRTFRVHVRLLLKMDIKLLATPHVLDCLVPSVLKLICGGVHGFPPSQP